MGICRLKWFSEEVAMGVNQNIGTRENFTGDQGSCGVGEVAIAAIPK